jgi:hypothetical protein
MVPSHGCECAWLALHTILLLYAEEGLKTIVRGMVFFQAAQEQWGCKKSI